MGQLLSIRECVVKYLHWASPHVEVEKLGLPVLSVTEHLEWTQSIVLPRHSVQDKYGM